MGKNTLLNIITLAVEILVFSSSNVKFRCCIKVRQVPEEKIKRTIGQVQALVEFDLFTG